MNQNCMNAVVCATPQQPRPCTNKANCNEKAKNSHFSTIWPTERSISIHIKNVTITIAMSVLFGSNSRNMS